MNDVRTYATLRIYTKNKRIHKIIRSMLSKKPTRKTYRNGDFGWFLTTQYNIFSNNIEDHINHLLVRINNKSAEIERLQRCGCTIDIFCFFDSCDCLNSTSKMYLPSYILQSCGKLNIELGFDVWS